MQLFHVTVEYMRGDGSRHSLLWDIRAISTTAAHSWARRRFKQDYRRRTSAIVSVKAVAVLEPIDEGDVITVPITGRVVLGEDDKVTVVSPKSNVGVKFTREYIERTLERPVAPARTVEYWSVYPNGNVYLGQRPVRNSSYPLEDLVQIKVTKVGGKIVDKEFV